MNSEAILSLISNLYLQLDAALEQNRQLQEELAKMQEKETSDQKSE